MKNIYYMIWVDGLLKFRSVPANKSTWKTYGVIFISMAMALNISSILIILSLLGFHTFNNSIVINVFTNHKFNAIIKFFILYLSPILSINYFFIFRNNRYEKLFEKYKFYNGKLCASYMIVSYFMPIFIIFVAYLIEKIFG